MKQLTRLYILAFALVATSNLCGMSGTDRTRESVPTLQHMALKQVTQEVAAKLAGCATYADATKAMQEYCAGVPQDLQQEIALFFTRYYFPHLPDQQILPGIINTTVSPDGTLITGRDTQERQALALYDLASGAQQCSLHGSESLPTNWGFPTPISITPNNTTIAVKASFPVLWNTVGGHHYVNLDYNGPTLPPIFTPNSKYFITANLGMPCIIIDPTAHYADLHLQRIDLEHNEVVQQLSISPDGKLLVALIEDIEDIGHMTSTLKLKCWEIAYNDEGHITDTLLCFTQEITRREPTISAVSEHGDAIVLEGEERLPYTPALHINRHTKDITPFMFKLVSTIAYDEDKTVYCHVPQSDPTVVRICQFDDGTLLRTIKHDTETSPLRMYDRKIEHVSLSKNGDRLLTASTNSIAVWNTKDGTLLYTHMLPVGSKIAQAWLNAEGTTVFITDFDKKFFMGTLEDKTLNEVALPQPLHEPHAYTNEHGQLVTQDDRTGLTWWNNHNNYSLKQITWLYFLNKALQEDDQEKSKALVQELFLASQDINTTQHDQHTLPITNIMDYFNRLNWQ